MPDNQSLRILLLGDYSNLHSQLGRTLRSWGHEVTVASMGSGFQDTERDINIRRRPGKLGGALLAADMMWGPLGRRLQGYDIVALQNPNYLPLRPSRLRYFFDRLKGENRSVFLSCGGTDPLYIRECLDESSPLKYNEYRIGHEKAPFAITHRQQLEDYTTPEMNRYCDYIYDHIDGAVTALYEYDIAVRRRLGSERVCYGGLPIDTASLRFVDIPEDLDHVRLFLGRHKGRLSEKGTGLLEDAARIVAGRLGGRVSLEIVENIPYAQYINTMCSSHVLLDQIYSYSPAMNALIGMAHGLNVVSGGESDYYDFIGEISNRPVINAATSLDGLVETLYDVCSHPGQIAQRGRLSRDFVVKHNDTNTVTARYLEFWKVRAGIE